jgi:hypothetical protein
MLAALPTFSRSPLFLISKQKTRSSTNKWISQPADGGARKYDISSSDSVTKYGEWVRKYRNMMIINVKVTY